MASCELRLRRSRIRYALLVTLCSGHREAGKVIGYDLLHVVFNPTAQTAAVDVVFVDRAGFMYGVATASDRPVLHGRVTGGTGSFKGATGTFVAKNLNSAGTKAAVTITYRT